MKTGKIFQGDKIIWVVFFLLSVISLIAVYSSIGLYAYSMPGTRPTGLFLKHLAIVAATYGVVILLSHINYRYFSRFAMLGYWASLVLLAVMLALHGRWFHLPVIGQFQPSEIAKVVLIIFVARQLALKKEHTGELGTFLMLLVYVAPVVLLVLPENFSTAALIFLSAYLTMLYGGVKRSYWWRLLLVLMLIGGVAMFVMLKTGEHSSALERSETWVNRVDRWIHPNPDELSQENMAKMAIARGGAARLGIGSTVHARLMTQAHNDFIYAIIIEETGMVGGLIVFALYSVFFFRCVRLALRCKGPFGAFTVAGLGTMIYLQALVNMCVAVGVLPVTGQTLPFISYGGTAYIFLGCSLGVIQSVAADVEKRETESATSLPQEIADTDVTDNSKQEKLQTI
jgi:cell division protein FtsW